MMPSLADWYGSISEVPPTPDERMAWRAAVVAVDKHLRDAARGLSRAGKGTVESAAAALILAHANEIKTRGLAE